MNVDFAAHGLEQRSPYRSPRVSLYAVLALCSVGLLASIHLAWLHYRVHTDPGFHSFCAINDSFNCETVAESSYAVFLGLPVAVWGILGYLLMGLLAVLSRFSARREAAHAGLIMLSCSAVVCSLALAVVSYCVICSFCLFCTVIYVINAALVAVLLGMTRLRIFPWREAFRECARALWSYRLTILLCFLCVSAAAVCFPKYWEKSGKERRGDGLWSGITDEGAHWIGAEQPLLTVTEYSDYLCPHCRRGHLMLRELLSAHPGRVKLIHKHFPLDRACNPLVKRPFHEGACRLAAAAYCAGEQGNFWEMNDRLGRTPAATSVPSDEVLLGLAVDLGLNRLKFDECVRSDRAAAAVRADIASGLSLGISGTPSLVVDGQVYVGVLPKEVTARLEETAQPKVQDGGY